MRAVRRLPNRVRIIPVRHQERGNGVKECEGTLYQAVRLTQARSLKLLVSRVMCWLPLLPHGSVVEPPPAGSPKNHSPLRGPTVLGGTFGARAQGRPRTAPPQRRHVMPLAMRPLRDQMAHCRRTLRLPSALTRSPRRSRGLTPCERLVSGSTSNEITSCQATSRSCRALFRLRIRTVVLGDALNECAANVCPTHPPYGGICEDILLADAALLLTFLTCSRFVKEQRRKI